VLDWLLRLHASQKTEVRIFALLWLFKGWSLSLKKFHDGSANFSTLVIFQRKTHFTFHRRNGGAELSYSSQRRIFLHSSFKSTLIVIYEPLPEKVLDAVLCRLQPHVNVNLLQVYFCTFCGHLHHAIHSWGTANATL